MTLVLNSFGASLTKKDGLFYVTSAETSQSIHPQDVKTIMISRSAKISSDAILLAVENEIDVLFVDNLGKPKGRVWSVQYGSISDIRKKQVEFLYGPTCIAWVKQLIAEKINNQLALLLTFKDGCDTADQRRIQAAINSISDHRSKIEKTDGEVISDVAPSIRGWEGAAGRRYFEAINLVLPPSFRFEGRSQYPPHDKFNSMLGYGYGILYGKIEGALIKAGIDPYVGVFHRDEYNRPALVFDVIEKFRIWVDFVMIRLAQQEVLDDDCFTNKEDTVLLDGLGKRIVIQSMYDYLAEIIDIKGLPRSRATHIDLYAQSLAQEFLKA
ncbi:CRISPR-associated endonuclease Cas1 [Ilyomonas limi]|uniref:CRISPR-associated endonuclease Cas1 n=1 Tax=Ilyomonas limi TaxID=2575867 RepID=A0A4U3KTT7_9BACT|nr:CRISPR-associated endonuclease Cas1 [Ilyomonas limi]TKK65848.1 CRISPR-associated endonuclease Cas1 [Ilyomonas limi]